MMKKYIINISNCLNVPINYYIYNGENMVGGRSSIKPGTSRYEFFASEGSCIRIYKENKWVRDSKYSTLFMFIYSLDLVWGNISESDNLPIGADFEIRLAGEDEIYLHDYDILTATEDSISSWNRGRYIQYAVFLLIAAFICFVIYMTCPFPINIIICILILIGAVSVLLKLRKNMRKMRAALKKYVHN